MRKFSIESLRDERQRFDVLLELSAAIERLERENRELRGRQQSTGISSHEIATIRASLMAGGPLALNVQGLAGILSQSQRGFAVLAGSVAGLPDPSLFEIGTLGIDTSSFNFYYVDEGMPRTWAGPIAFPVTGHNVLSGTHSDALAASVVRGDLIAGNSTPKWARLALGAAHARLRVNSGGTDPVWEGSYGACAYRSGALTVADNTITTLVFDVEDFDRGSICNAATGIITVPAGGDGPWIVMAGVNWDSNNTGYRELNITAGGLVVAWDLRDATTGNPTRATIIGIANLAATNTISATVIQTSGGNLNLSARSTFLAAFKL